ncbi:MAG: hypothetical protein AW07_02989 [Candidatus Accumulibacter sp. SK-11]|nr:MAG: hypothetical protein AW07_02989 [Candidatus Accumulibacter sp. SK-11]
MRECVVALARLGDLDEAIEFRTENLAFFDHVAENLLAGFGSDRLFELGDCLARRFACFGNPVELLLDLLGFADQKGVTRCARDDIDLVDHVVGPDRLREAIIDHGVHLAVEMAKPVFRRRRESGHQDEDEAEAQAEPGADAKILEHEGSSRVAISLGWCSENWRLQRSAAS